MILTRGDVRLRPWEARDAERVRAWANDPYVAERVGRAMPVYDVTHAEWFQKMVRDPSLALFAIEFDRAHIGNIWLHEVERQHQKAEVRILIGAEVSRGKGVGTIAIELLTDYAHRGLNLSRCYAYVLASNPTARRAFEKAGYTQEGLLAADRWVAGAWRDVWLLGKTAASRGPVSTQL